MEKINKLHMFKLHGAHLLIECKHHEETCAGILEQFIGGYRNRVVIGLSYPSAGLHRLADSIPWNRFMGSLKF